VAIDQVLHKQVLSGAAGFGEEEADRKIDAAYANARAAERVRADGKARKKKAAEHRSLRKQKRKGSRGR
jgi:hypothetical protein